MCIDLYKKYNPVPIDTKLYKNISGIYQIRNLFTNHIYIGSARNLHKRKLEHFRRLLNQEHVNKHLQNSYNKYGKENFVFELVELCSVDDLLQTEQYWLNLFVGTPNCYNIQKSANCGPLQNNGNGFSGRTHSKYTKQKISKSRTGKNLGQDHPFTQKIICLETKQQYWGTREAMRATNIRSGLISKCCRGLRETAGGLHWMFLKEYKNLSGKQIKSILEGQLPKRGNYKQVICIETLQIYPSAQSASKQTGVDSCGIKACCKQKMVESGGFHWMYYVDYLNSNSEYIYALLNKHNRLYGNYMCLETGIIYPTLAQAAREYNTTYKKIKKVCEGKLPDIDGYHFIFYDTSKTDSLVRPIVDTLFGKEKEKSNENK